MGGAVGYADGYWVQLADGVFARRYTELDLTVGLVVGGEQALVVDTRGDRAQGAELAAAVRAVTTLPLLVVYTHAHFDHCFGTSRFPGSAVYAHAGCAAALTAGAETQRAEWTGYYLERGDPDTAAELAASPVVMPSALVDGHAVLDLGDRGVQLRHLGPGHTDHDLVVDVPDAGVLFAGDLVEQGGPPDFTDAFPLHWPFAIERLRAADTGVVVPGHGDPVTPGFVATQHEELVTVAALCRAVLAGEAQEHEALARSPYPESTTRTALVRARTVPVGGRTAPL